MNPEVTKCLDCEEHIPPGEGLESKFSQLDGFYCRDCPATPRIALVGCGASKVDLGEGETVPAKDLYDSTYFALKREYAEECCNEWRILSAEHGLLDPQEEIGTYDASLNPSSDAYIGDYEAGKWAVNTSNSLSVFESFQPIYAQFVVLAGKDYLRHIEGAFQDHRRVEYPFRRDDLDGIGDQMGWLREEIDVWNGSPGQAAIEDYATDGGSP